MFGIKTLVVAAAVGYGVYKMWKIFKAFSKNCDDFDEKKNIFREISEENIQVEENGKFKTCDELEIDEYIQTCKSLIMSRYRDIYDCPMDVIMEEEEDDFQDPEETENADKVETCDDQDVAELNKMNKPLVLTDCNERWSYFCSQMAKIFEEDDDEETESAAEVNTCNDQEMVELDESSDSSLKPPCSESFWNRFNYFPILEVIIEEDEEVEVHHEDLKIISGDQDIGESCVQFKKSLTLCRYSERWFNYFCELEVIVEDEDEADFDDSENIFY